MYRDNYKSKYIKYKNKYLTLSRGGGFDNLSIENVDLCSDCYVDCFSIKKNGIKYKPWSIILYGRTYYGWSEYGEPPESKESMEKKVDDEATGFISKFEQVYNNLSQDDKEEIDRLYPNLLTYIKDWLPKNKQYILMRFEENYRLYKDFDQAFRDEGAEPHIIFRFLNEGGYQNYLNDYDDIKDEVFYKNENYKQELEYKNMVKTNHKVNCDTTKPDYNLYKKFCENPDYTPKQWPFLDLVYNDILR